jgi:hypothetical protein
MTEIDDMTGSSPTGFIVKSAALPLAIPAAFDRPEFRPTRRKRYAGFFHPYAFYRRLRCSDCNART